MDYSKHEHKLEEAPKEIIQSKEEEEVKELERQFIQRAETSIDFKYALALYYDTYKNDLEKAAQWYKLAIDGKHKMAEKRSPDIQKRLNNLASRCREEKNYEKAFQLYTLVRDISSGVNVEARYALLDMHKNKQIKTLSNKDKSHSDMRFKFSKTTITSSNSSTSSSKALGLS